MSNISRYLILCYQKIQGIPYLSIFWWSVEYNQREQSEAQILIKKCDKRSSAFRRTSIPARREAGQPT